RSTPSTSTSARFSTAARSRSPSPPACAPSDASPRRPPSPSRSGATSPTPAPTSPLTGSPAPSSAPPRPGTSRMSEAPALASATLAQLYMQQGHLEQARRVLARVLARDPFHGHALALAGRLALRARARLYAAF